MKGSMVQTARSIAMNQAVGTICATFKASGSGHGVNQPPIYPVDGPWLNNSHSHKPTNRGTLTGNFLTSPLPVRQWFGLPWMKTSSV
jgi:hypothetical protein